MVLNEDINLWRTTPFGEIAWVFSAGGIYSTVQSHLYYVLSLEKWKYQEILAINHKRDHHTLVVIQYY